MRKYFFLFFLVFLGAGCQTNPLSSFPKEDIQSVTIGEVFYHVEVKDSPLERSQGLSGRQSLPTDTGILFIFDKPEVQNFWMKEMQFPLDFIWIKEGVVIGLDSDIPHPAINNGEIARLSSPEPADAVLEVNAGQIDLYGLKVGDLVKYLP